MELHRGRLIDHVHLRTRNLRASQRFYAAVFEAIGIPVVSDKTHLHADEFWVDAGEMRARRVRAFISRFKSQTARR